MNSRNEGRASPVIGISEMETVQRTRVRFKKERLAEATNRLETHTMRFDGRVFYDFSPPTWMFYRFLAAAGKAGAGFRLDWRPFLQEGDPQSAAGMALAEAVRRDAPDQHGEFLQALLALRHLEGADLTEPRIAAIAAETVGFLGPLGSAPEAVAASTEEGRALGGVGAPTIHRHGPVLKIEVNPAALRGDVLERLRLIDGVLEDDGIWTLEKP